MADTRQHEAVRLHGPNGSRITEPHMTGDAVAALLRVSPRTVRKYARDGTWPHTRPPGVGSPYLFCQHDVDTILGLIGDGR